jgi:hypothetical protein
MTGWVRKTRCRMKTEVSRRIFVGSVAAGLPLLAGAGARSFAQSGGGAHTHPAVQGAPDPVFDHVARQLADIHNRAKARGMTGEDARTMAAHLRTLNVYGRQINIDDPMKKALRALLNERGSEAALYIEVDRRAVREELKRYGVVADDRWFDTSGVDYLTRVRSRDDLLKTGITGVLARTAVTFDNIATELDRRGSQTARVVRVQTWQDGFCQQLIREIMRLEMEAGIVCSVGGYYAPLMAVCGMIQMAAAVQMGAYLTYC